MKSHDFSLAFPVVCGVFGVLLFLIATQIPDAFWKEIVNHIGTAFVIACIVGISTERYFAIRRNRETQNMLEAIREDVFKASLGANFPPSLWIQVWNHLLTRQVIRKNVLLDYQLESIPDYPDYLKLTVCWSFTLCNLNPAEARDYHLFVALDRPFNKELSKLTKIIEISIDGNSMPLLEPQCHLSKTNSEEMCEVTVPLNQNQEKRIVIKGETVLRNDTLVAHSMVDASENLEISVLKPDGIEVVVDPLHARETRLIEIPTASDSKRKCWRIDGGILPGQGVNMRWYPTDLVNSK